MGDTGIDGVALRLVEWTQGAASGTALGALSWTELLDPFPQGVDDASAVMGLAQIAVALTVVLMNALSQAVFVVDARGCVLLLNRLASKLVGCKDALTVRNGVLRAASPSDTTALHRSIATAGQLAGGNGKGRVGAQALRLERPSGNGPLPVLVAALPEMRWTQPNRPVAAVLVGREGLRHPCSGPQAAMMDADEGEGAVAPRATRGWRRPRPDRPCSIRTGGYRRTAHRCGAHVAVPSLLAFVALGRRGQAAA
ncbi:MAG TPA: hypothetical protein VMW56_21915, partial [Candidatus Margulisiibacteriota bacterium]|nr:hypothetical protein [Candidatus Margulisiibacteriota bacterium]